MCFAVRPWRVANTPPVEPLARLAIAQLAPPHDGPGEKCRLAIRSSPGECWDDSPSLATLKELLAASPRNEGTFGKMNLSRIARALRAKAAT